MLLPPQYNIISNARPVNVFIGGYGSGKTTIMGSISYYFARMFPHIPGIIAANTYKQLTNSTFFRIYQEWEKIGLREFTEKNPKGQYVVGRRPPIHFKLSDFKLDSYDSVISFINGAVIFKASLENYKALDGMEVGWVMLDETKDTRSDAMSVIVSRLRYKGLFLKTSEMMERSKEAGDYSPYTGDNTGNSINPLFIFTAPAKVPWLNDFTKISELNPSELKTALYNEPYYFQKLTDDLNINISATHCNAANLPVNYIPNLVASMPSHLIDLLVHGYPFATTGGEFYHAFNREYHVKNVSYNPYEDIHISFDENVMPYQPCGVWQVTGKAARKVAEFDLEEPKNNIFAVCEALRNTYMNHKAAVYVYGDATSNKRDSKLRREGSGDPNFFSIVRKELAMFNPKLRVPISNPGQGLRGDFINAILEKNIFDISITIDPVCKNTIEDYEHLKKAEDGGKLKELYRDPQTSRTYQKYGHDTDLDDYFLCQYFKAEYASFARRVERNSDDEKTDEQVKSMQRATGNPLKPTPPGGGAKIVIQKTKGRF